MALIRKRVLIVEDEILIAISLASEIEALGGEIVKMVDSTDAALEIITTADLDAAILDVTLRGERTFVVADALAARHIPFVFTTAVSADEAPARYANIPWLEKPFVPGAVCRALAAVMSNADEGSAKVGESGRVAMTFAGKRVLIVEDDSTVALGFADEISASGGEVIGMVESVDAALEVIASTDVDGAILDVRLRDQMGFPIADALAARHIPFVFESGYIKPRDVPARHACVPCLQKPLSPREICRALEIVMCSANIAR